MQCNVCSGGIAICNASIVKGKIHEEIWIDERRLTDRGPTAARHLYQLHSSFRVARPKGNTPLSTPAVHKDLSQLLPYAHQISGRPCTFKCAARKPGGHVVADETDQALCKWKASFERRVAHADETPEHMWAQCGKLTDGELEQSVACKPSIYQALEGQPNRLQYAILLASCGRDNCTVSKAETS